MNYLIFIAFIPLGVALFLFFKFIENQFDSAMKDALIRLDNALNEIDPNAYKFYTTGHPYVWCDTNLEEIKKSINDLKYSRNYNPNDYLINICNEKKSVYFIQRPAINSNWEKLMHYQEWLDSQKQVADNIHKYKNS